VIWLNGYFGTLEMNGVSVENSKLLKNTSHAVHAFIRLNELNQQTFGVDFSHMLENHLTFKEALASSDFTIMARWRLTIIRGDISQQIDQAYL